MTTALDKKIWVDAAHLAGLVERLSRVGAQPGGGIIRHQYSAAWSDAQALVGTMMADAGLSVRRDAVGNVFGRLVGEDDTRTILTGSHIDTVTFGGAYDGALGVLSAIAALEALAQDAGRPRRSVEAVSLCEEEGGRFRGNYFGTRAILGRVRTEEAGELTDAGGITLSEAARAVGLDPARFPEAHRYDIDCFVEVHIEQGRTLIDSNVQVGVVDTIVGLTWLQVEVTGRVDHAGATPMTDRRDALQGAVRMVAEVDDVVRALGHPAVGTVGALTVLPGAPNIVPGTVSFTVDMRHLDIEVLQGRIELLKRRFAEIATKHDVSVHVEAVKEIPAHTLNEELRAALHLGAGKLGLTSVDLPSGAGHDSQTMGTAIPAAMIFVPSVDGRSHSPAEYSTPQDCANGASVLATTLHSLAW